MIINGREKPRYLVVSGLSGKSQIGYWVLEEACRQMRAWQIQFPAQAPLTISVNFSARQFLQPDIAHSMGMNVTAEGVETAAQLTQLKAIKCEYGQGYFFSKPVDSKAAGALIAIQPQ